MLTTLTHEAQAFYADLFGDIAAANPWLASLLYNPSNLSNTAQAESSGATSTAPKASASPPASPSAATPNGSAGGTPHVHFFTESGDDNPPVANGDSYDVMHDRTLSTFEDGVLANDTDADGDSLTASLVSGTSHGSLQFNSDGSFTYTPNAGYVGTDSFQYQASDGTQSSNVATATINVTDNAPVANDDTYDMLHDHELDIPASGFLFNDSDDDSDPLTASLVSGPSNGSLQFGSDGSFTYTPNPGYVGSDSFAYQADDGAETSNTATVTIDVTDQAPVANNDDYTVAKNSAATPYGSVLGNDTDADGDTLTATLGSGVSHGTLDFHSDGSFTYQPTFGYTGSDSFTYTASDGAESSDPATVTLTVEDEGVITADSDSYSIRHDSTLSVAASGVLANDSDSDGDDLTASLSSNASNGSLTLNSDGSFTYKPNAGWTGMDSFQYTASDGSNTSDPVTVTIDVTDQAPIANDDSYSVHHDQELDVDPSGVLANDSDADGDKLTPNVSSQPGNGTLEFNSDGSFTYVPNIGYVGSDSFTYTVSDGALTSDPATVTIDVTDQAPTAGDLGFDLPENSALNVSAAAGLLSAASDADGDDLTASVSSGPSNGSLSVNSDGSFTYTPDLDYSGSDSFQYTVSDGALTSMPATVTLTIHAVDTAPTAGPASYSVVHDWILDVPTPGLLAYTGDADGDTLTVSAASGPSHGILTVNSDGSFSYTPDTHYVGTDSFTYIASDGTLSSDPATVTIDVTDQAPVANDDTYSVERNNDLFADEGSGVLANDSDPDGDPLTASLVSGPSNGTLSFNGDTFDYTPNHNFIGTDSFTYKANDGVLDSPLATVTLTVTASPPVAGDDSYDVKKDHALNVPANGVLANDSSPDNLDVTAGGASQPAHGSVSLNSDGSFTYTPDSGYTGSDSFTYTASDGTLSSDPATVSITVKDTNTPPTAGDVSYTLNHDTTLSTDADSGVLSAASDADDDKLSAGLVSSPTNGTLSFNGDGSFTYTPNAGFHGTDSFQFEAFDGTDYSNVATATLNVVNNPPTANADSYTVLASGTTTISAGVLANDSDPEGDLLTAVLASGPSGGDLTFNSDGSFSYTPNASFTGSDSFTYEASDGVNLSAPATVTLTSGPVAANWSYSVLHDHTLSEDAADGLLNGASDADGDSLTAALATGASNGMVTVDSDGSFTYVPNTHFVGSDSFTYTVSDGTNTSAPATVTISVINNPPSAADASYSLVHDQTLTSPSATGLLANASDPDGDALTAQLLTGPSNGTLQLSSGGGFTYTPNRHFVGTDTFTYEASDGVSTSDPATVFLFVTNAAPVATNDNYSTSPGQAVTVGASGVLANDVDPDGDSLTAQLISGPTNGTLTPNSDGSFTYVPNSGFSGDDSFTYQASDGITTSNTATVTITVSNAVVANNDEFATGMNQALTVAAPGVLSNDTAPTGETLTAVLDSGPADGTLALNSDGSFTYTPDTGFTGDDSFTYYASANGVLSANPATVVVHVVNVTLAMPNGSWVPINANNDNKSRITNMIPATRDYAFQRQLPANDPELQPLNITIKNPNPLGFIDLEIQPTAGSTGQIRLEPIRITC